MFVDSFASFFNVHLARGVLKNFMAGFWLAVSASFLALAARPDTLGETNILGEDSALALDIRKGAFSPKGASSSYAGKAHIDVTTLLVAETKNHTSQHHEHGILHTSPITALPETREANEELQTLKLSQRSLLPPSVSMAQMIEYTGDQPCPCVKEDDLPHQRKDGQVLLPFWKKSLGEDFKRPQDFGTSCKAWDKQTAPLCDDAPHNLVEDEGDQKKGDPIKKSDGCTKPWCFIYQECACGEAKTNPDANMTVGDAALTEISGAQDKLPIYFSYLNCDPSSKDAAEKHMEDHCKAHPDDCKKQKLLCAGAMSANVGMLALAGAAWLLAELTC